MHQIPGTNCQALSKECSSQPHKLAEERAWVSSKGRNGVLGEQFHLLTPADQSLLTEAGVPTPSQ